MNRKGRFLVCVILFLSVFSHSYMWSENKHKQKIEKNPKKQRLRVKNERGEDFLRRIQGEVSKSLQKKTLRNSIKPESKHIDPDFARRAPKDAKVVFTQDLHVEKKTIKTRLDVKLGSTRKVTQITKVIGSDKWKVQYDYHARKKRHSFRGDAEIAGFETQMVISSKQKPAFAVRKPIQVGDSVIIVPHGRCDFESKNYRIGFTGNVNKNFTAAVFVQRSPDVRTMEYCLKGSLHNIVDIKLQGRTLCRPENPKANRATHKGMLIKKIGKHVSVQAGLQYENAAFSNPSFSVVYSRKF